MTTLRHRVAIRTAGALVGAVLAMHEGFSVVRAPAALLAQVRDTGTTEPTGNAIVSGTVVTADDSHRPVRRATVSLSGRDLSRPRVASTDDNGRFELTGLAAGAYSATVTKPGYVSTYYGSHRPGRPPGTPLLLADNERRDLTISLTHGAVVTGVVTDGFGQPLPNIRVTVLEIRMVNGERRLVNIASNGPSGGLTDETGTYRIWGLPPGTFVIAASPNGIAMNQAVRQVTAADLDWARLQLTAAGRAAPAPAPGHMVGYTMVYFPGVVDPSSATQVTVEAGLERGGLNFPLVLVPTATISGTVLGLDGQPVSAGAQIMLTTAHASQSGAVALNQTSARGTGVDLTGKFSMPGVGPGEYTLTVRTNRGAAPGMQVTPLGPGPTPPPPIRSDLWASTEVDVSGEDVGGLVLTLRPGMTISGHVVFEGTSAPVADRTRVRVGLSVLDNDGVAANTPQRPSAADGTFTVSGVTPGRYRPTASIAPAAGPAAGPVGAGAPGQNPWRLKSALWHGQDLLDVPLEVQPSEDISDVALVFTDLTTELSGSLLNGAGRPATGYIVVVFPADPSLWLPTGRRERQTQPDTTGTYKLQNLPAGQYFLGAVTDLDPGDLGDPSFLEQLATASLKVTITEGGKTVQNLRLKDAGSLRYDLRK